MLKIKTEIKVTASEEAKLKAAEDLQLSQPTDEERKKIIGSILSERGKNELSN